MRLFTLLLVIAVGLITGYTVVKFVHVSAGATAVVNIQLVAFVWAIATLFTGLWLMRRWIAWQWSRFTAWLELRLDGLFELSLTVDQELSLMRLIKNYDLHFGSGSVSALRRAMDAIHRHPDGRLNWQASNSAILEHMERQLALAFARDSCAIQSQPEGRQPDGSYVIEVGMNETAAEVMRRHPDTFGRIGATHTKSGSHSDTLPQPGTPEYEACAQGALDDAAKTTCTACGELGHWSPDCPISDASSLGGDLLPCRGCSWCGVDPGDLPNELWTECDGSGRYLPNTEAERQRQLAYLKPAAKPPPGTIAQNKA